MPAPSVPYVPNQSLYPSLSHFGTAPNAQQSHPPPGFPHGVGANGMPTVNVPLSVNVPASVAEKHQREYEELARKQRQELLALAGGPPGSRPGPNGGGYNAHNQYPLMPTGSNNGGFPHFPGSEMPGMPVPQSMMGHHGNGRQRMGFPPGRSYPEGMDEQYLGVDGLYSDVKKRKVAPVYDAGQSFFLVLVVLKTDWVF